MSSDLTPYDLKQLHSEQLSRWETAYLNYKQLDKIEAREVVIEGVTMRIQHNPGRIGSVSAQIDKKPQTNCFLCAENLPDEQIRLPFGNDEYHILVNPFPIFKQHFTIPATTHTPQRIEGRMPVMLQLAREYAPYTIFYNGPRCGASAPMHMHFQAAQAGCMPIEEQLHTARRTVVCLHNSGELSLLNDMLRPIFVISATAQEDAITLFDRLYKALPPIADEEPMMNIMVRYENNGWILIIFPRAKHRPDCYYAQDESQRLISPGTVEMGGLFITPRHNDYEQLTTQEIANIYSEVSASENEILETISQLKKYR